MAQKERISEIDADEFALLIRKIFEERLRRSS